jgi:hypothetical protein
MPVRVAPERAHEIQSGLRECTDHCSKISSDMQATVMRTREVIEQSRALMARVDEALCTGRGT